VLANGQWGRGHIGVCGRHRSSGSCRRRPSCALAVEARRATGAPIARSSVGPCQPAKPTRSAARIGGSGRPFADARGLGHTVVIAVQDDHTRLVYAELHSAENARNVSITLRRGAAWMQGCGPVEAVLSDNAKCYTGHLFADALDELGARHIRIPPPYTPRWNGKLERFIGTLEDEWAHGRVWPNSTARDRALSSFLRYFNRWRPHSAAGGRAPITRVQQERRQDS
jgi:transposase InsO family protein